MVANEKLFNQLAEARAEIERLSLSVGELNGSFNARPKCEKCKTKDRLIEQMRIISEHRKAIMLEIADSLENNKLTDADEYEDELIDSLRTNAEARAALSAAERGERL
jgi:hypothetical protein